MNEGTKNGRIGRRHRSPSRGRAETPAPSRDATPTAATDTLAKIGNRGMQAILRAPSSPFAAPSDVRIHSDASAAASAAALDAAAYTRGNDIYFGEGRYRPESPEGRRLLLHELTHVAQQRNAGPHASESALEREADEAAETAMTGRVPDIALSAPERSIQRQSIPWKSGDVIMSDQTSIDDVMNKGGLFSGNDQAHVNVSNRGKLAYDPSYTTPEDAFRWSKLKNIVDGAHLKIQAVSAQDKFKVVDKPGTPPVDRSLSEIRMIVGDLSVMGIALKAGENSPDATYDMIYYDKAGGIGALTHELFGHEWLALRNAPSKHPPAGSKEEAAVGTIQPQHGVQDPFGNVYAGTVRNYIGKYIESLGSNANVVNAKGATVSVPKSPTQNIGRDAFDKTFNDFYAEANGGGLTVTRTQTSVNTNYSAKIARLWRLICDSYDLMPKNKDAINAGNSNLFYTKEVVLTFSYVIFSKLGQDAQKAFRVLLADFTMSRAGFKTNELSTELEKVVGAAPSIFSP